MTSSLAPWTRPQTPQRERHFVDALTALYALGRIVTTDHLVAGLVAEPGREVLGQDINDVLHAMGDVALARSAEALTRPIQVRIEHVGDVTRVHVAGIRADLFLFALAERYGIDEPRIVPGDLALHHSLDLPAGVLVVRDWDRFATHFCVELVDVPASAPSSQRSRDNPSRSSAVAARHGAAQVSADP